MMHNISIVIYRVLGEDINKISELVFRSLYEYVYMICMKEGSLASDPFFASLFSFLFVRDINLAHHIKNCSLHSLVLFSHRHKLGLKRQMKKMQKCKLYVAKKQKRLRSV